MSFISAAVDFRRDFALCATFVFGISSVVMSSVRFALICRCKTWITYVKFYGM